MLEKRAVICPPAQWCHWMMLPEVNGLAVDGCVVLGKLGLRFCHLCVSYPGFFSILYFFSYEIFPNLWKHCRNSIKCSPPVAIESKLEGSSICANGISKVSTNTSVHVDNCGAALEIRKFPFTHQWHPIHLSCQVPRVSICFCVLITKGFHPIPLDNCCLFLFSQSEAVPQSSLDSYFIMPVILFCLMFLHED